ncbi:sodium- and chloride-dependent GABA transporter 1-like [Diadema antillarum]|uniref:sodium- and chloride-dependent GABA transporter 1-like n=1 Tax=Diadema antillarum TaxID=105358 RepID=UPI003A8C745E
MEENKSDVQKDQVETNEGKSEEKRDQWSHKLEFLLTAVGYSVGLGNVWRFPYLCYKNGGGAFLIPYFIFLFIAGIPLLIMEYSLGQFPSLGCVRCYNISPIFRGLGMSMILVNFTTSIYYAVIVAWALYYMGASCLKTLPWSTCDNPWNSADCFDSSLVNRTFNKSTRPSEEYWKVEEKVVYFTAVFPYVVLLILFFRGVTLPGAGTGVSYYITPRFEKLLDVDTWKDAAVQIFYSTGISFGTSITLTSYNKFRNNCYRDAITVCLINSLTSLFAGFVVFSVLGFMAHDSGQKVPDVVDDGPGLVFVVYPEALSRLPLPQFWSFLFFFMIVTLGLDSQFCGIEAVGTVIADELSPATRKKYKKFITMGVCVALFVCGIPICMQGGLYVLTLMDWFTASYANFIIASCTALRVHAGRKRFVRDIAAMTGSTVWVYFQFCWAVLSPLAMLMILILSVVFYIPASLDEYTFPDWAQAVGLLLALVPVAVIPTYIVYALTFNAEGSLIQRFKILLRPHWTWGPAQNVDRVDCGYLPFPPGRGGPIPVGYEGPYASEGVVSYAPTKGVSIDGVFKYRLDDDIKVGKEEKPKSVCRQAPAARLAVSTQPEGVVLGGTDDQCHSLLPHFRHPCRNFPYVCLGVDGHLTVRAEVGRISLQ